MDVLKKLFPLSFKAKDIVSLIIYIVIYLVVGIVALAFSRQFHFFHTPFIHLLYTFLALRCMELYEDTFLSESRKSLWHKDLSGFYRFIRSYEKRSLSNDTYYKQNVTPHLGSVPSQKAEILLCQKLCQTNYKRSFTVYMH